MKLDKELVEKLMVEIKNSFDIPGYDQPVIDLALFLQNLDLIVKPGDSSQGTLVENNIQKHNRKLFIYE